MKNEILSNLDNPTQLERLYLSDKPAFKRAFNLLYPELKDNALAGFWNVRLNFAKEEISWGTRKDLLFLIIASFTAGLIAKLPAMLHIDGELFYSRNVGFIIFPILSIYFAWKNKLPVTRILVIIVPVIASIIFINSLPDPKFSDSSLLSCIHMILFLWAILGFAFVGEQNNNVEKRLRFLSYNGDLVVITTLIVIAAGIVSAATIGLFSLIGLDIKNFYFEYIVVFGLPAAPILGTYLTQNNPQLVGRISPVIAKIFSPIVLVMLVIYLAAIIYSGKDPYNNREFLIFFNGLLAGVMAIIFFSIAETTKAEKSRMEIWILLLLSIVTIVVNGIALSAILFRISEWGLTPNRAAVLGGNVIILVNLVLVTLHLFKSVYKNADINKVGKIISSYLPVYCVWAIIVTFLFPLIFGFR